MSNFEHRIKEDSTEFEKAFLKIYDGSLWAALEKMKDWQPPKKLVEVPQFVADWFEKNKHDIEYRIWSYSRHSDRCIRDEFFKWFDKNFNKPIETLIRMKLEGYTVKKEKKYILKHIDLSKLSIDDSLYLAHGMYTKLQHVRFSKDVDLSKVKNCHFTQSEIDELNIGSYEQIPVKVDEV